VGATDGLRGEKTPFKDVIWRGAGVKKALKHQKGKSKGEEKGSWEGG